MSQTLERRIRALLEGDAAPTLAGIRRGLEKESLRITPQGRLAQTPHPAALGSALTHPAITTDYSEALLEFITPASATLDAPLTFLDEIHRFVYANIGDEILWVNSMPCMVHEDAEVPIANYGSSNVGRMKHVYRQGLGHRYGRKMQAIAGIHYNFSYPEAFWQLHQQLEGKDKPLQTFINERYFDLLRNFLRYSWLLVYLFGASPAVCASFLAGRDHQLLERTDHTLFRPYATSLRMSDLGYQNNAQSSLHVSPNNLDDYVSSLHYAISTPEPAYQDIGVLAGGEYRQLNANILQIENEYYSSIRPKRTAESGERPTQALLRRGVEYIELRVLDLNPFEPLGIGSSDMRFIDLFATYCLLRESPWMASQDVHAARQNIRQVVYNGRNTDTRLCNWGQQVTLQAWAEHALDQITPIAELFDRTHGGDQYARALARQREKVAQPESTPSGQIMDAMERREESFYRFAMNQALAHRDHFLARPLEADTRTRLDQIARDSLAEQDRLEASEQPPFDAYLEAYFGD